MCFVRHTRFSNSMYLTTKIHTLPIMRNFIPLFALLFAANTLFAQVNWLSPTQEWTYYFTFGFAGPGIETLNTGAEVQWEGKTYTKMIRTRVMRSGSVQADERLLRQEGRKLYAVTDLEPVKKEFLMYDFGLKVGDTVRIRPVYTNMTNFAYVIRAIGTVQAGNEQRATQTVEWINKPSTAKATKGLFVEGTGYVLGTHVIGGVDCMAESFFFLDEPSSAVVDGPERNFCTLTSGGAVVYENVGNTFCRTLPASAPLEAQVKVWPTLSKGQIFVENASENDLLQVSLLELSGRLIQQQEIRGSGTIQTDYKGSAFLQISSEKGKMTQKVVLY